MAGMSPDDHARLRTWNSEIAQALLPPEARREDRGADWHFTRSGGLAISKRTGAWYRHAAGCGGYSALRLIEQLRACSRTDAEQWAIAWLASHAGTGSGEGADDAADSPTTAHANAARAQEVIAALVPPEGTVAAVYLRSRGIAPPYPACVKFLADARIGETAMVGLLTAHDVVIGAQLTYLDPQGRKSVREPVRQTFVLDRERSKGAVFMVDKLSSNGRLLLCEGLEDGLSLQACTRPEAIFALPGIASLSRFQARRGQQITVVPDGDEPDSPAAKALIAGVDHLLLQRAEVRVAATPRDADANSILQQADGAAALNALVDAAATAELSAKGEARQLAQLAADPAHDRAQYDRERRRVAKKHEMRLSSLDAEVTEAKRASGAAADKGGAAGLVLREPDPWPDAVELATVLRALRERLEAHLHFEHSGYATLITVWVAHTHVYMRFEYTPRLAIDSPEPRCGKTSLGDILALVCARPVPADGVTPASLVRLKAASGPVTVLLDEMADALAASPELEQVLRSGFQRGRSYIKLEPQPDGSYDHLLFDVFAPVAIALVGSLKGALADRAAHIHMRRKPKAKKLAKLRHGNNRATLIGRKLARWALDDGALLAEPDDTGIPEELNDRQGDFSAVLLAIADQAGGTWPTEVRAALVAVLGDSEAQWEDARARLLRDIRTVFDADLERRTVAAAQLHSWRSKAEETAWVAAEAEKQEMASQQLVAGLLALEEAEWAAPDTGRPLSQHKLARMLFPFGIAPRQIGHKTARKRGYLRLHFEGAWSAYTHVFFKDPPVQSVHPVKDGGNPPKILDTECPPADVRDALVDTLETQKTADFGQHERGGRSERGDPEENIGKAPSAASDGNSGGKDFSFSGRVIRPGKSRPGPIVQAIRELAAAHPHWTESRLASATGQPLARVRKALADWTPPVKPNGSGGGDHPGQDGSGDGDNAANLDCGTELAP
jgi:hypothetical protein